MGEKRKETSNNNKSNKKTKVAGEIDIPPCSFEDDLALMESIEGESQSESQSSNGYSQEISIVPIRKGGLAHQSWRRPAVPEFDPSKDTLTFQQLEVDHYVGMYVFISKSLGVVRIQVSVNCFSSFGKNQYTTIVVNTGVVSYISNLLFTELVSGTMFFLP